MELDDGADEAALDAAVGNWRALLSGSRRTMPASTCGRTRPPTPSCAGWPLRACSVGAFTPRPEPLARVAAAHLGVARRLERLEAGPGALDRLLDALGRDAVVVGSLAELQSV